MRKIDDSFMFEAKIFGIDVARYGDNASVLMKRQGNMTWKPRIWREINHMVLADQIAAEYEADRPAAVFIDKGPIGVEHGSRAVGFILGCNLVDRKSTRLNSSH